MSIQFTKNTAIVVPNSFTRRIKTGFKPVDTLLGNGLVAGQVITVCGNRGSGKTQFMLQIIDAYAKKNRKVGYLSCEETIEQIAYTANRIEVDVPISTFNTIDDVLSVMDNMDVLVLDSLSMINIGNKRRLRFEEEAIDKIYEKAKKTNCTVFVVIHMTKNGTMKGSSYLAHKVDTNLHIETFFDEEQKNLRKLYTTKNRFGSSSEILLKITKTEYDFDNSLEEKEEVVPPKVEIVEEIKPVIIDSNETDFLLPPKSFFPKRNKRRGEFTFKKIYHKIKRGMEIIDNFLSK